MHGVNLCHIPCDILLAVNWPLGASLGSPRTAPRPDHVCLLVTDMDACVLQTGLAVNIALTFCAPRKLVPCD